MSQYDFGTMDPTVIGGSSLAGALNAFRTAINSSHKGPAAPSYQGAGLRWCDDSNDPIWLLKFFDGAQWITETVIDTTTNLAYAPAVSPAQRYPLAGGTANVLTLTPDVAMTAYVDQDVVTFEAASNNSAAATLNISGVGAKAIRKMVAGADAALVAGDLRDGGRYQVNYDSAANAGAGAWILLNPSTFTEVDPWAFQPIGVPIPVQKNVAGVSAPPTDQAYRYILLTAGETGAGKYNNGVLGSESVTGSAPLVQATASVTLAGSPLNGQTIRLLNTERRFLRAGSAGTVENDQMQQITGEIRSGMHAAAAIAMFTTPSGAISNVPGINNAYPSPAAVSTIADGISFDSANSPNARTGTETRSKNIGVEYYMRIK